MNKYRDALKADMERAGGDLISLYELGVLEDVRFDDDLLTFKVNAAMFEQFYGDDYEVEPVSWSDDRCLHVKKFGGGCKVVAFFRKDPENEDA